MKNLTAVLSLLSLSIISVAHANDSKMTGTWITDCQTGEVVSRKQKLTFNSNGTIDQEDSIFTNENCWGSPTTLLSKKLYTVLLETAKTVTLEMNPVPTHPREGEVSGLLVNYSFMTADSVSSKIVAAKITRGGVQTSVPSEEIASLPEVVYSRE